MSQVKPNYNIDVIPYNDPGQRGSMAKKKRELETPAFLHDWPLRDGDTAHFYFDEYARTLARLIADKRTRTPLTVWP